MSEESCGDRGATRFADASSCRASAEHVAALADPNRDARKRSIRLFCTKRTHQSERTMTAVSAITVADARSGLAELLNRVAYGKERLVITRHGREIAAIVPVEDLQLANRLRRFVARKDVARALADLDAGKSASWDRLRQELGL
jgi:prevent-host-death family protein